MKYKIIFSENAGEDLMNIVRYISDELLEPAIAEKLSKRILKVISALDEFPMRYRYNLTLLSTSYSPLVQGYVLSSVDSFFIG